MRPSPTPPIMAANGAAIGDAPRDTPRTRSPHGGTLDPVGSRGRLGVLSMSDRAARTAARPQAAEPATPHRPAPAALAVGSSLAALGRERRLAGGADQLLHLRQLPPPLRHQAILGMQRTIGNHAVLRM